MRNLTTDVDLDHIQEDLRRQRVDLDQQIADQTQSHETTKDLLKKIEALRERMERSNHIADAPIRK